MLERQPVSHQSLHSDPDRLNGWQEHLNDEFDRQPHQTQPAGLLVSVSVPCRCSGLSQRADWIHFIGTIGDILKIAENQVLFA